MYEFCRVCEWLYPDTNQGISMELACQISTRAPLSGLQRPLLSTPYTLITRCKGMPSCTEPSEGSDLISDRLGILSTKYGPSVC